MLNPFPGMNPYLEHPARWPSIHQGLITYTREILNQILPSGYAAEMGERLYVVQPDRNIYPDVAVLQHPTPGTRPSGGVAVAPRNAAEAPWVLTVDPIEMREVYIEVVRIGQPARIVTVVEVLSPSNKASGSPGRELYLTKQQETLEAGVNLLEIDLLRSGAHTVAAPYEALCRKGTWDYLACLHRGTDRLRWEVWPISLRQPLPTVLVPLGPGDPDVELDLQAVFNRSWETSSHARFLDYNTDPVPPLAVEDQAWADELLREQSLK